MHSYVKFYVEDHVSEGGENGTKDPLENSNTSNKL